MEDFWDGDSEKFVMEPRETDNAQKDFTSLECWQKARKVKLFFFSIYFTQTSI